MVYYSRYKKKILELAKQHDKASEIEKVQRYNMPTEKGELQSYLEEDLKEKVWFHNNIIFANIFDYEKIIMSKQSEFCKKTKIFLFLITWICEPPKNIPISCKIHFGFT